MVSLGPLTATNNDEDMVTVIQIRTAVVVAVHCTVVYFISESDVSS